MILFKQIGLILACIFFLCFTDLPATTTVKDPKDIIIDSNKETFLRARLRIAQNSGKSQEKNATDPAGDNDGRQKSEKKTQNQAPGSKSKTDPLKTFEPSEKVKADQAVDFPYDI